MATDGGCRNCSEVDHKKLQSTYECVLSSRHCNAAVEKPIGFEGLAKHTGA